MKKELVFINCQHFAVPVDYKEHWPTNQPDKCVKCEGTWPCESVRLAHEPLEMRGRAFYKYYQELYETV